MIFSASSFAIDQMSCTDVDLRDQLGPVRDQGDIGWCYANASADILTGFFKTKALGYMSADQLAMIYNYSYAENSNLTEQSGDMARTLKIALRIPRDSDSSTELLKFGYCADSLEKEALASGPRTPLSEKIRRLNELKTTYDLGVLDPEAKEKFWNLYHGYETNGSILGKIPETTFISALQKSTPSNFLLRFADIICGTYRFYNDNPDIKVVRHAKDAVFSLRTNNVTTCEAPVKADLLPDIHRMIGDKQHPQLVGIAYLSALITRGGNLDFPSSGHAGVVVGRRWHADHCELLVRNSWGSSCMMHGPDGTMISRYSTRVQACEDGNLWIRDEDIQKAVSSVVYIIHGEDQFPVAYPHPTAAQCQ